MAKELSQKEIKEMVILARFKNGAFKAGVAKKHFQTFVDEWELQFTEFSAGHYMEVVMAWMLGFYRATAKVYLRVEMSFDLDIKGCDFRIMKDRRDYFGTDIDMKFDKAPEDDDSDIIVSHYVARTYPKSVGRASNKRTMCGAQALASVLAPLFTAKELEKQVGRDKDFMQHIGVVWKRQSEGWIPKKKK